LLDNLNKLNNVHPLNTEIRKIKFLIPLDDRLTTKSFDKNNKEDNFIGLLPKTKEDEEEKDYHTNSKLDSKSNLSCEERIFTNEQEAKRLRQSIDIKDFKVFYNFN